MGQSPPNPKVMKNGSCSATPLPGSTAFPFVISTEAKRSGEICGFSFPVLTQGLNPYVFSLFYGPTKVGP